MSNFSLLMLYSFVNDISFFFFGGGVAIQGNSGSRNSNLEVGREWHNSERSSPGGRSSDRNIRYYYDERRSPRFSHEHSRSSGSRRNPVRFEVVDDRVRDNGVGGGRRTESSKFSSGESRQVSRLPDSQRKVNASSYPGVRPLSNLLGGNISPIHVAELPNANDRKGADASAHVKVSYVLNDAGNLFYV